MFHALQTNLVDFPLVSARMMIIPRFAGVFVFVGHWCCRLWSRSPKCNAGMPCEMFPHLGGPRWGASGQRTRQVGGGGGGGGGAPASAISRPATRKERKKERNKEGQERQRYARPPYCPSSKRTQEPLSGRPGGPLEGVQASPLSLSLSLSLSFLTFLFLLLRLLLRIGFAALPADADEKFCWHKVFSEFAYLFSSHFDNRRERRSPTNRVIAVVVFFAAISASSFIGGSRDSLPDAIPFDIVLFCRKKSNVDKVCFVGFFFFKEKPSDWFWIKKRLSNVNQWRHLICIQRLYAKILLILPKNRLMKQLGSLEQVKASHLHTKTLCKNPPHSSKNRLLKQLV